MLPLHFSNPVHSTYTYPPMKMEQCGPKRRYVKFRRRRITQKKCWGILPLRFSNLVHSTHTYLPMKMGQCSETSVCKIQTPANYPEEMLGYITPIFLKPSSFYTHLPAYEDGTECSETSACKIQTPANYPEESIQHSEQGESLKSRMFYTSQLPLHTFCAMIYFWCVAHDTLTKNECAST